MSRATYSMLFLVFSTTIFSGQWLTAEEPANDAISQLDEASVSFERLQFTVSRHKGRILIDGFQVPRDVLASKSKEVRLIETFDGLKFATNRAFLQWAQKLKSPRTYTYDAVTRISTDGTTVTQPLVFFDNDQRGELDTKWQAWLDGRQAILEEENRIRLAQEQEAQRYQQLSNLQNLQAQALAAQAAAEGSAQRSAQSLVVISGETSLWEVELVPAGNSGYCPTCAPSFSGLSYYGSQQSGLSFVTNGSSLTSTFGSNYNYGTGTNAVYVRAYGRTSQIASEYALNSNPGYRTASIRRLAGY